MLENVKQRTSRIKNQLDLTLGTAKIWETVDSPYFVKIQITEMNPLCELMAGECKEKGESPESSTCRPA